jgi:hypothetical protein
MKADRAAFLRCALDKMDAAGVAWCCLRNHEELFKDSRSDVDLMVLPEDVSLFETFLDEACQETGTRLAQEASYLNFSRTYLTPSGQWVRIDYETEVRWRIFPVLAARAVLLRRIRQDGIWTAGPADEAVVLWIAGLFRRHLSDRYRARLFELHRLLGGNTRADRVFREAFGSLGGRLLAQQLTWLKAANLDWVWENMQWALILRPCLNPTLAFLCLSYLGYDLTRIVDRLSRPRGLVLVVESPHWGPSDSLEIIWKMDRVFPVAKSLILQAASRKLGWKQRLKVALALFKGGLVLRPVEPGFAVKASPRIRWIHAREKAPLGWESATQPSGWMTAEPHPQNAAGCYEICIQSLTMCDPPAGPRSSLFCVLLGLDGAGKTTLARQLAHEIPQTPLGQFRYFHFLPGPPGQVELPWPFQAPKPKKREVPLARGSTMLSVLRLARNWGRAWCSLGFRRRNFPKVLLGDRYLYNYLLDPASVRYSGPASLAAFALRWAPRPDLIFVLQTPPETILRRKRELSPQEMGRQIELLGKMPLRAGRVVRLDGTLPPQELARQCLKEMNAFLGTTDPADKS